MQVNTTDWQQFSGTTGGKLVAAACWQAQVAGSSQDYYQTFTAVAADRATERLTTEQTTDTSFATVGGQWTRPIGRATLIAGADFQRTDSTVEEFRYSLTNVQTGPFFAGGTERTAGRLRARQHSRRRHGDRRARRPRRLVDLRADRPDAARPVGDVLQPARRGGVAQRPLRAAGRGVSRQPHADASTNCTAASASATSSPTPTRCSIPKR